MIDVLLPPDVIDRFSAYPAIVLPKYSESPRLTALSVRHLFIKDPGCIEHQRNAFSE